MPNSGLRLQLIEVVLPLDDINRAVGAGEVHPVRSPEHVVPLGARPMSAEARAREGGNEAGAGSEPPVLGVGLACGWRPRGLRGAGRMGLDWAVRSGRTDGRFRTHGPPNPPPKPSETAVPRRYTAAPMSTRSSGVQPCRNRRMRWPYVRTWRPSGRLGVCARGLRSARVGTVTRRRNLRAKPCPARTPAAAALRMRLHRFSHQEG